MLFHKRISFLMDWILLSTPVILEFWDLLGIRFFKACVACTRIA